MENNRPQVRFKGFTKDWIPSKLGEIGEVKMCKRIFSKQTLTTDGIPFYKIGTFGKKADAFISPQLYKEFRDKYPFPSKGDILISASGTIGKTVVYDGKPAYFQDSNIVWLNNDESQVLNEFLCYIYGNISYDSEGGTIKRLYNNIILNARFTFPNDKTEQQKIGAFFENLDKLLTEHQQKHIKLTALKKAMLAKMFPKQGQTVPEVRFKGYEEDWEKTTLEKTSDFFKGKGLNKNEVSKTGRNKCILYGHLFTEYGMIIENISFYTNMDLNKMFVSQFGDVLIPSSSTTPTGIEKASSIEKDDIILGGDINILRPKKSISGSFLSININAIGYKIIPFIKGITVRHLYNSDLKTVEIHIPKSLKEQEKIVCYFKSIDQLITKQELQIKKLQNIKKAFLAKMFI